MGMLVGSGGERFRLRRRTLVGRHRRCDLQLGGASVSSEHAILRWTDRGWQVRDLGSRNGTWVRGLRLRPGASVLLRARDELAFGAERGWAVLDDGPPGLFATRFDGLEVCGDLVLSLPSERDPQVRVVWDGESWEVRGPGRERGAPVEDGDVLAVGRLPWRLSLPGSPADLPRVDTDPRPAESGCCAAEPLRHG